jgi:hypothetical protein
MTDRPILFSAPMVRALLKGWKTQTRRLAHEKPRVGIQIGDGPIEPIAVESRWQKVRPGDRLWVREACQCSTGATGDGLGHVAYLADGKQRVVSHGADVRFSRMGKVRPSIHMPRWASRLTLLVTDVRVQRLQEIAEDDARAEGVSSEWDDYEKYGQSEPYRYGFSALWSSLHGAGAWDANPEVVAITFEVQQRNIDDYELVETAEGAEA